MFAQVLVAGVGVLVLFVFAAIMTAYSATSTDHGDQSGMTVGMSLLILLTLGELLLILPQNFTRGEEIILSCPQPESAQRRP